MIRKAPSSVIEPEVLLPGEYSDKEICDCINKMLETIANEPRFYVVDPESLLITDLYDEMPDVVDGEG